MFNRSFLDIYYTLSPLFICFRIFLSLPLRLFGENKLVKSIKLLPLRIKLINSIQLNHKFVSKNVCYDVFELISFGMCSTQKLSKYVTVSVESSYYYLHTGKLCTIQSNQRQYRHTHKYLLHMLHPLFYCETSF